MVGVSFRDYFRKLMKELGTGRTDYETLLPMTIGLKNNLVLALIKDMYYLLVRFAKKKNEHLSLMLQKHCTSRMCVCWHQLS